MLPDLYAEDIEVGNELHDVRREVGLDLTVTAETAFPFFVFCNKGTKSFRYSGQFDHTFYILLIRRNRLTDSSPYIDLNEVGTGVGLVGEDVDVLKVDVRGVANKEAFGGQSAPHGGFRVLPFLLVLQGLVNRRQVGRGDATLMVQGDIRQPDILDRVTRQSRDATAHRTGMANLNVIEAHTADTTHMVDGNEFGYRVVIAITAQRAIAAS